jgi:hypothetical protein
MNPAEKVEAFERKKSTFTADRIHSAIVDLDPSFSLKRNSPPELPEKSSLSHPLA